MKTNDKRHRKEIAYLEVKQEYNLKKMEDVFKVDTVFLDFIREASYQFFDKHDILSRSDMQIELSDLPPYKKAMAIKYKILPLKTVSQNKRMLGVFNFDVPANVINRFFFDEIVFIDKSVVSHFLEEHILHYHHQFPDRSFLFQGLGVKRGNLVKGVKSVSSLTKYLKREQLVFYISHLESYLIIKGQVLQFQITSSFFEKDLKKFEELIDYTTSSKDRNMTVIDTIGINNIEDKLSHLESEFRIKYFDKSKFRKIYKKLAKPFFI
ncbi:MAG: hypothetical protein HOG49_42150 [Candidatus Scalindua sp.]|jgi:hypothetical protein|nr:hypothetical protein [Candidatus Scalindua sp.]